MNVVSRTACWSKRIALFVLWSAVLGLFAASTHAQSSFNYAGFSSTSGLQLNGSATTAGQPAVLRLTPNVGGQDGSTWYTNPASANSPAPLSLANGFTTTFGLRFSTPGGIGPADGIAFIVQNGSLGSTNGAGVVAVQGGPGGQLGYDGLTNSVAVQFDVWCNGEYGDVCAGGNSTTSADQVSIQSCGAGANTVVHGACTYGAVDLSRLSSPIYLGDGNVHTAQVSYTAPTTQGSCTATSALGSAGCGSLVVILDGQTILTVPFNLASLGLDSNQDAYPGFTASTGGGALNQDVTTWSFQANVSSAVSQPINISTPPSLPANFNTNTGNLVTTDTDYTNSGGITPAPNTPNPVFLSVNNTVSQTNAWSQYVVGTPFATSLCTIKAGNGGTNLCSLYVNACYNAGASPTTADDINCPTVSNPTPSNYITLRDRFDWGGNGMQPVAAGTTISLLKFSPSTAGEKWGPSAPPATSNPVCTLVAPVTPAGAAQCDVTDSLVDVFGDQTTTRGTSPKTKGWLISVYGVPMPLTHITACNTSLNNAPANTSNFAANIWSKGSCPFDISVSPATPGISCTYGSPTDPCNNFQAAPIASLLYGKQTRVPAVQPGPIPQGDTQVSNLNPICASTNPCNAPAWDAVPGNSNTLSSFFGADGTYTLHWSAKDSAGITEKNIQIVPAPAGGYCPVPAGETPTDETSSQCYATSYFTAQVNIDSKVPTISAITFSNSGPGTLTAKYTCTDDNVTGSGLASCGPLAGTTTGNAPARGPASLAPSETLPLTVGVNQTITRTATDLAGNTATSTSAKFNVYNICALYDQTKSVQSGKHIFIKMSLCDANGTVNYSNSAIQVHATALIQVSNGKNDALTDDPDDLDDLDFQYLPNIQSSIPTTITGPGYRYNLSTRGLCSGQYYLQFVVAGDPTVHQLSFWVR